MTLIHCNINIFIIQPIDTNDIVKFFLLSFNYKFYLLNNYKNKSTLHKVFQNFLII